MFWNTASVTDALAMACASVLVAVALARMVVLPSLVSDAASSVAPPSSPTTRCSIVPFATLSTVAVAAGVPVLVTPVSSGSSPGIVATAGRLTPGTVVVVICAIAGIVRLMAIIDVPMTSALRLD